MKQAQKSETVELPPKRVRRLNLKDKKPVKTRWIRVEMNPFV